jgi:DNA-binding transcriptional MerR regulator
MPAINHVRESPTPDIPDKLFFRIGEVARVSGIKQHVLRYWETEFPSIAPKKSGSGHRLYRRKDVELILEIKRLLYEERFTIEGARKFLQHRPKRAPARKPAAAQGELFGSPPGEMDLIRKELQEILRILE